MSNPRAPCLAPTASLAQFREEIDSSKLKGGSAEGSSACWPSGSS